MRNKLFYYLCWLTAVTGSLQAQAQNKVVAPMKDVNQVIDNTLDSLNKARTARPIAGSSRKGDRYLYDRDQVSKDLDIRGG